MRILIVEDEPLLLKALNIELLSAGFEVLAATDGEMGLHIIEEEKPDLVLLDLLLPKKNGFEILTSLSQYDYTKKIPVIILSNLDQKEGCLKCLELGAVDYFIKSNVDLNGLIKRIKQILKIK